MGFSSGKWRRRQEGLVDFLVEIIADNLSYLLDYIALVLLNSLIITNELYSLRSSIKKSPVMSIYIIVVAT